MGVPVSTADYTAGKFAVGADVEADIDAIIAELDGSLEPDNFAASCITTPALANDSVDANKIKDGEVRETHMDYDDTTSGVKVWQCGPNYVSSSGSGGRIARVSKEITWDGSANQSETFTYDTHCVDGDPDFSATPTLLGAPCVASVEAVADTILKWSVTAHDKDSITLDLYNIATNSTATVQVEFGVAGPV